jgi:Tfp pilus assembly protein PilE
VCCPQVLRSKAMMERHYAKHERELERQQSTNTPPTKRRRKCRASKSTTRSPTGGSRVAKKQWPLTANLPGGPQTMPQCMHIK